MLARRDTTKSRPMGGAIGKGNSGELDHSRNPRSAGGRQAAEHAGQRTMGRPSGRRLVRHSPSLPAHKGRS
jgi:hypothetical protein